LARSRQDRRRSLEGATILLARDNISVFVNGVIERERDREREREREREKDREEGRNRAKKEHK